MTPSRALLLAALLWTLPHPAAAHAAPAGAPAALPSVAPTDRQAAPAGFNVHLVRTRDGHRLWRGGAPRSDTFKALLAAARSRKVGVTFIDLRHPPSTDDLSGKGGRLTPSAEEKTASAEGFRYLSISALDKTLNLRIDEALAQGDVYLHCMYGVNRTGFAIGRYATARGLTVDREGLGERDYSQGEQFERGQR